MALLRIILILIVFTACQSEYACPPPNSVKLKRMSAHRLKYYKVQMQERAMARNKEAEVKKLRKANEREIVRNFDVDEWDCPKPGTSRHDKLVEKQRKKLEKQSAQNVKKKIDKAEEQSISGTKTSFELEL